MRILATMPLWAATRSFATDTAPEAASLDMAAFADRENFQYIFATPQRRRAFRDFLTHVFHLFPEDELDQLIAEHVATESGDRKIYLSVQEQLGDITPFMADIRYSLPTLLKQKRVMATQTSTLLGEGQWFDGYVEYGSEGRYYDELSSLVSIKGPAFTVSNRAPTNSPIDMLDRGQFSQLGTHLPLNDYATPLSASVPKNSIDLVTVYIGFHHCPLHLRESFLADIRDAMRPGAAMIVRDHQVTSERMWRMVSLAHDVFNMGTEESWAYNAAELRHFYTLEQLDTMLTAAGFKTDGRRLRQRGDPTHNTLMLYVKV